MKEFDCVVEEHLKRAAQNWGWLQFVQYSAGLGILAYGAAFVIGVCADRGWLAGMVTPATVLRNLLLFTFASVLLTGLLVVVLRKRKGRLVEAIEQSNPRLLDRLNTLWFLTRGEETLVGDSFRRRITNQLRELFRDRPLASPGSSTRAGLYLLILVLVATATHWFYATCTPLSGAAVTEPEEADRSFVIPEGTSEDVGKTVPWYEARIVRPGRNLEVAKNDQVPLRIEVASSEPIERVAWHTMINSGDERVHDLPRVSDSRFALYEPTIDLEEFGLAEWDCLTYYVEAALEKGDVFASDVYFVEVRPSPEELDDLPEAPQELPLSILNQLTGLIACQQEVIRESHRQEFFPAVDLERQKVECRWLAQVEKELAAASDHLSARVNAEFESSALETAASHLDAAGDALMRASDTFLKSGAESGGLEAKLALRELLMARRLLSQNLTEKPEAIASPDEGNQEANGSIPEALNRTSDFLDSIEEGVRSMWDLVEEQKDVVKRTRPIQGSLWSVFTTGVKDSRPVDEIVEISLDQKEVFIFVSWHGLSHRDHVQSCKMYDGSGRLVEDDEMSFHPSGSVYSTWNWHVFSKSVDVPGDWKFHVDIDQLQVIDKTLKVLPPGIKPKTPGPRPASHSAQSIEWAPEYAELAQREDTLQRDLAELEHEYREVARRVHGECQSAKEALGEAAAELRNSEREPGGQPASELSWPGRAASQLEDLAGRFEDQAGAEQMTSAYTLKRLLDGSIEQMKELEQQSDSMTDAHLQEAAQNMKELTSQMKRVAEEEPTSRFFRRELRDVLDDEGKRALDAKCDALSDAQSSLARQGAAREIREGMQAVGDAFEESRPALLTALQRTHDLQRAGNRAERGAPRSGGLTSGQETPSSVKRNALSKSNDLSSDGTILQLLKEYYPPGADVDERIMQKLIARSGRFRVETVRAQADERQEEAARHVDPAMLPTAYRDRIERYYEKLSEQEE